jgi:hypothetical protein
MMIRCCRWRLEIEVLFTPQFLGEQLATSIQEKQELGHQSESAFIRAWRRLMGFDCNCVYSVSYHSHGCRYF